MGWTLRQSDTLIAAAYGWVAGRAFQGARAESLRQLPGGAGASSSMASAHIATRTDVVFEHALAGVPGSSVLQDQSVLLGGWFRRIVLEKGV